jgi:hypothetical protein
MKFYLFLFANILFISLTAINAREVSKTTLGLPLGESVIKVNVYEKQGAQITFFAPHHNEQIALKSAKEAITQKGGRLVELESFNQNGKPERFLAFGFKGKSYRVDPNRIFTANGRRCAGFENEVNAEIENFSKRLLAIIFPENAFLPGGKRIVVAVHNNTDVDNKNYRQQTSDLTAPAFVKNASASRHAASGAFEAQAAGVYLSNVETDADNFILLSSPRYLGFFAENNFNVVVQKSVRQIEANQCGFDDGSLSVYAGQNDIEYICLEADAVNGGLRQKQMIAAVYVLFTKNTEAIKQNEAHSGFNK